MGVRVTPAVAMAALTVILEVAFLFPSTDATVMTAVPAPTAVTVPVADMVATALLLEVQVKLLLVAVDGSTVAVMFAD